ncbi:glycosyltransferase family 9 protein [Herbaspirillum sp. RTI4]|uniref:glycosyltransferase family 9 protein n=1 Tax=Herbaspirillum sp. RTI4 TaxID=3048640 RepID=UPI002AB3FE42|nr:glycosyltransferase family 9 protein [Herbaspirillum sp. RTI4]MDY7580018.1 glycosyltransferase family 9 protein [Herbaspirillum sp. RTI4]MEA9982832.1 glycosyltransferase family 9 protein [Herbaspirillum sp. RTI4]
MTIPLVSEEILKKTGKILFIAHLAIGDFTYLQNCFLAFSKAYPHIKMHLWVDEVRRTDDASKWPQLKSYSLYDWVRSCGLFEKVYTETYSPALLQQSVRLARRERYPLVVSLATLRPRQYARLARDISGHGLVVGLEPKRWWNVLNLRLQSPLDGSIAPFAFSSDRSEHISDVYADWFQRLFGMHIRFEERFPFVAIPAIWKEAAQAALTAWGVDRNKEQIVFINSFAKTPKRCWPLENVAALIAAMRASRWSDSFFIVNAMPQDVAQVNAVIAAHDLSRVVVFSAQENFYQLPAMLEQSHLIISVETAVMHLANAVHVPVVALMRQKNPEWAPVDKANSRVITAARRRDWVSAITVQQVMESV